MVKQFIEDVGSGAFGALDWHGVERVWRSRCGETRFRISATAASSLQSWQKAPTRLPVSRSERIKSPRILLVA